MTVAYDGRPFQGWQSQAHGNTVQDRLETAFAKLCGGRGSPCTAPGARTPGSTRVGRSPTLTFTRPADTRRALARRAQRPPPARNPRAVGAVRCGPVPRPFLGAGKGLPLPHLERAGASIRSSTAGRGTSPASCDLDSLRQAAHGWSARHDFAAFAANRGKPDESTVRTIRRIVFRQAGALLTLDFEGDGFLYKMVRLLTGSLVRCAQGRASLDLD